VFPTRATPQRGALAASRFSRRHAPLDSAFQGAVRRACVRDVGRTVETRAAWLDSAQGGKRSAASLVAGPQPDPSESKGNAQGVQVCILEASEICNRIWLDQCNNGRERDQTPLVNGKKI